VLIAAVQHRHGATKNRKRESKSLRNAKPNAQQRLAHLMMRRHNEEMSMNAAESKGLKKGSRVYWLADANDGGVVTEMRWDAVTIAWDNGHVATVHHGDMREIHRAGAKPAVV
jgi:hypothetical protein